MVLSRNASRFIVYRLLLLNNLLNMNLKDDIQLGNHVAHLENQSPRFALLVFASEKLMNVDILLPTGSAQSYRATTIASVHTLPEHMETWVYLANTFLKEMKRLRNCNNRSVQHKFWHLGISLQQQSSRTRR